MDSAELQGNKQLGHIKDTEGKETMNGEQLSSHKHICYTCIAGAILGVSGLVLCYLVLSTAVAYAIP